MPSEWHEMRVHDSGNSKAVYMPVEVVKVMGRHRKKYFWRFHRGAFILRPKLPANGNGRISKNGAGAPRAKKAAGSEVVAGLE